MYRADPVSRAGSSVRSTRVPRIEPAIAATYRSPVGPVVSADDRSGERFGRTATAIGARTDQMPNGAAATAAIASSGPSSVTWAASLRP